YLNLHQQSNQEITMKQVYSFRLVDPETKEVLGVASFKHIEDAMNFYSSQKQNDEMKIFQFFFGVERETSTKFDEDLDKFIKHLI
ncbi:MAG: hypothetical protein KDC92_15830, partial [Bacteroidetes bacterium]|nr:hypothetical protein [Bacteroidota bacterium]